MKPLPSDYTKTAADELTDHQRSTFLDPNDISQVLLQQGDALWRFVTSSKNIRYSTYWITDEMMKDFMSVIHSWNLWSENGIRTLVRDAHAIPTHFETPQGVKESQKSNFRFRVKVKTPIVGYVGKTAPQRGPAVDFHPPKHWGSEIMKRIETRIGGYNQIVVPCFQGIGNNDAERYIDDFYFAPMFKKPHHEK